jgi:2-amino-4-hydroxy-6-hydroxymethyldihydropteridine diphosphokinase
MIIYLGIGTNVGDRASKLREALRLLDERVGTQLACSSLYRSQPQGFASDNDFANIVVAYCTDYSAEQVLHLTQLIEREMGRTQKSVDGIYHDRIIDIDLLYAYSLSLSSEPIPYTCSTPTLTLPHPRMTERDFVMIPLKEVLNITNDNLSLCF